MWRQIALGLVALWALFVVSMRTKFRPVIDGLRAMTRTVFNPREMRTAGQPGAHASVVHHVGRTSGMAYATPVVARRTDEGFAIALPYGTRADWVKNVLAAGRATIVHDGGTYRVDRPQVRPTAMADGVFTPKEQWAHRLYGVGDVLLLRRADAGGVLRRGV